MNKILANIAVLNQKVYNFHWNVRGEGFLNAHKMTEAFYELLTDQFDQVAEKIAMNGETPISTLAGYIEASDIQEIQPKAFTAKEVFTSLVKDIETLKKSISDSYEGSKAETLLDEIVDSLDLQLWLIKSSI